MSKAGTQTIEITKKQYEDLFLEMNPGYFDRDYVKKVIFLMSKNRGAEVYGVG